MGVVDPEVADKPVDAATQSMRPLIHHWNETVEDVEGGQKSSECYPRYSVIDLVLTSSLLGQSPRDNDEGPVGHPGRDGLLSQFQRQGASTAPLPVPRRWSSTLSSFPTGSGVDCLDKGEV